MRFFILIKQAVIPWNFVQQQVHSHQIFVPFRPIFDKMGGEWPTLETYNDLASSVGAEFPFRFVDQNAMRKSSRASQSKVGSLGSYVLAASSKHISTRIFNVHDLFNVMTYLMFPKTKSAIMELHLSEQNSMEPSRKGMGGRGRTRLQDLLTLFDEGGAIASQGATQSLIVFGHGVLEEFITSPKQIRVFAWHCGSEQSWDIRQLDQNLSVSLAKEGSLSDKEVFSGCYLPPGWI
jgi:hypothetical protein